MSLGLVGRGERASGVFAGGAGFARVLAADRDPPLRRHPRGCGFVGSRLRFRLRFASDSCGCNHRRDPNSRHSAPEL
jgi:hypothetical protein